MKKMLLAAAASAAILTSNAFAMNDQFYLKVEGGASILNKVKKTGIINGVTTSAKLKSNTSGIFGAGVGFYVMDNFRSELTFDMLVNPRLKKNINVPATTVTPGTVVAGTVNLKHKANIGSLLLSGYVDFYEANGFKLYAGAGIGAAQVREKITLGYTPSTGSTLPAGSVTVKTKRAYNFAYQVGAGASAVVADGVSVELGYSWRDYGKTKSAPVITGATQTVGKTHYRGHNVIAGLRFDI